MILDFIYSFFSIKKNESSLKINNDKINNYLNTAPNKLFCPGCGSCLKVVPIDNEIHGDVCEQYRNEDGIECFLCENLNCSYHFGVLLYHHPKSLKAPAGDSWSLSWMK